MQSSNTSEVNWLIQFQVCCGFAGRDLYMHYSAVTNAVTTWFSINAAHFHMPQLFLLCKVGRKRVEKKYKWCRKLNAGQHRLTSTENRQSRDRRPQTYWRTSLPDNPLQRKVSGTCQNLTTHSQTQEFWPCSSGSVSLAGSSRVSDNSNLSNPSAELAQGNLTLLYYY